MTNLEWFNEIGMIAENEVWTKTPDLKGQIGVNLVIALRDDDFKKYSEKGFGWLLEEHKEPIKLKQWEYDLIRNCEEADSYSENDSLIAYWIIEGMKKNGHFKGIKNLRVRFKDILSNYIIVSDDYEGFEECK